MSGELAARGDVYPGFAYREIRHEARSIAEATATRTHLDDLIQYGALGLIEARARYDPDRGTTFRSFAKHRVRGAILDGLRESMPLSRRAYVTLRGRVADSELISRRVIHHALAEIAQHLALDHATDPEEDLLAAADLRRLRQAIARLTDSERAIIVAVYDLDENGDSGAALAARLGVSRSTVSKVHRRVIHRLRAVMEATDG